MYKILIVWLEALCGVNKLRNFILNLCYSEN